MSVGISNISTCRKSVSGKPMNGFDWLQHEGRGEHDRAFKNIDINSKHSVM